VRPAPPEASSRIGASAIFCAVCCAIRFSDLLFGRAKRHRPCARAAFRRFGFGPARAKRTF
jgi:hypothetical protein